MTKATNEDDDFVRLYSFIHACICYCLQILLGVVVCFTTCYKSSTAPGISAVLLDVCLALFCLLGFVAVLLVVPFGVVLLREGVVRSKVDFRNIVFHADALTFEQHDKCARGTGWVRSRKRRFYWSGG